MTTTFARRKTMRTAYRVLAYLIAAEVVIQAAAIAYAIFGMGAWVEGGGVLDKATQESETTDFAGLGGFILHGINGQIVVPVLALALLIVSFFTTMRGAAKWAGIVVGVVVLQVLLGVFGHPLPLLGMLHGLNALVLLVVALIAARLSAGVVADGKVGVAERADVG
jgi:amino acid transporter